MLSNGKSSYVGLQLLPRISNGKPDNIVVKSSLKPKPSNPMMSPEFCYLQTCHLCNKKLSLDKDVYMYKGDQGFCSVECRNRQIETDERKELEISTKQMLASYRNCNSPGRRETKLLMEDLRQRRLQPPAPRGTRWTIVA